MFQDAAIKDNFEILIMGFTEEQAVKLFANIYLALGRVQFRIL